MGLFGDFSGDFLNTLLFFFYFKIKGFEKSTTFQEQNLRYTDHYYFSATGNPNPRDGKTLILRVANRSCDFALFDTS